MKGTCQISAATRIHYLLAPSRVLKVCGVLFFLLPAALLLGVDFRIFFDFDFGFFRLFGFRFSVLFYFLRAGDALHGGGSGGGTF